MCKNEWFIACVCAWHVIGKFRHLILFTLHVSNDSIEKSTLLTSFKAARAEPQKWTQLQIRYPFESVQFHTHVWPIRGMWCRYARAHCTCWCINNKCAVKLKCFAKQVWRIRRLVSSFQYWNAYTFRVRCGCLRNVQDSKASAWYSIS